MKKELLMGIGAVATVGVIGAGVLMLSSDKGDRGLSNEDKTTINDEDQKKIDDLMWEEWGDTNKFSFCYGDAIIESDYVDPILSGEGFISHTSKELLLLDKTKQRMYVLTRTIVYNYEGSINTPMGDMSITVPIKEHGTLDEVYRRNTMPVRIDFGNNYISTNPDTKKTNWVYSTIGEETEMVMPNIGCEGVHKIDSSLSGSEVVSIKNTCSGNDISGKYEGEFSFACSLVDTKQARDRYIEKKELEDSKIEINPDLFNPGSKDSEVNTATDKSLRNVDTNEASSEQKSTDIQKALDEMKNEMNASQRE